MSNWKTRLRDCCKFVSPDGDIYTPGWTGNEITVEKRVAAFDYPLVDGSTSQDLGRKAFNWPMTLYFEGIDNDIDAWNFLKSMDQRGTWSVVHPVYGQKELQPITAKLIADPTGSGNLTVVDTTWLEPILRTPAARIDWGNNISATSEITVASVINQFSATVTSIKSTVADIQAAVGQINNAMGTVSGYIADANGLVGDAYGAVTGLMTGLQNNFAGVAGGIISLMTTPGLMAGGIVSQVSSFGTLASDLMSQLPNAATLGFLDLATRGRIATVELFASAAIVGVATTLVDSASGSTTPGAPQPMATRAEAVQAIDGINTLFSAITTGLDGFQAAAASNPADTQYFSQSQAYADLARLVTACNQFLIHAAFDLKAEKRFTLDRPRSTMEIAIEQYGQNGWDDSYFDYACKTNQLHGDQILWLPAGFEWVTYA